MKVVKDQDALTVNTLHREAIQGFLEKAIKIGEILTQKKGSLKHGEWLPWIKKNLDFSVQTAAGYIRCYEHREELNLQRVVSLRSALKLIAAESGYEARERALAEAEARIIHEKEHPEKSSEGKAVHAISPAGFKVVDRVIGQLNGLPIWQMEIEDENYWKAEREAIPRDLAWEAGQLKNRFGSIKYLLREALNAINKIQKKYGGLSQEDFKVDVSKGKTFPLMEIEDARKECEKMWNKVEKKFSQLYVEHLTEEDVTARKAQREEDLKIYGPKQQWARWGNEAGLV